jgi:hypothetical protein
MVRAVGAARRRREETGADGRGRPRPRGEGSRRNPGTGPARRMPANRRKACRARMARVPDCWRIPIEGRSSGICGGWSTPVGRIRGARRTEPNSSTVAYAADAAPGMMKMASALVDSGSETGGGPEAVDPLSPRARPTVRPGCRPVSGIVPPDAPGSTRSRMSPSRCSPPPDSDALSVWIAPARRSLCPHSGSGSTEARTPTNGFAPWCLTGVRGFVTPITESRPGFSEQDLQTERNNAEAGLSRTSAIGRRPGTLIPGRVKGRFSALVSGIWLH